MKATALLRRDHETLQSLFARLQRPTRANDKVGVCEEIRREIKMHSSIEEELFYPELENTASSRAAELVGKARSQHEEIDGLLDQLGQNGASRKYDEQVTALIEKVEEHLAFEEEEIFEVARQSLSEFRMEQLGLEMEDRRRFLRLAAA